MSDDNRVMIGYEEICTDQDLHQKAKNLIARFPEGSGQVADILKNFFTVSNDTGVPRDVFDYFCTSDFFSLFVDEASEVVRKLVDFNAELGWYKLVEDVFRNQKSVAPYCKEIYRCFTQNYSVDESRGLYEASEKPSDMMSARKRTKQDAKSTTINKQKTAPYQKQNKNVMDSVLTAVYEKLNQNYEELSSNFGNLSKECHDFGSYLSLLMEDNQKIRAAHLECQIKLDAEKQKNAVLEAKVREQDDIIAEQKVLLQQLGNKMVSLEQLETLFPTDRLKGLDEKSDQIMGQIRQLLDAPQVRPLEYTKSTDLIENSMTSEVENLNFSQELTEEELYALQTQNELSEIEQTEHEMESFKEDVPDYENEFGMPDEETLNEINGATSEILLFDPETDMQADDGMIMSDPEENVSDHGIPDAKGDEPTISFDFTDQIEIKDHYQEVKKKANVFASLVRNFEKRRFERKNVVEQKNLLFQKMREFSFEAERIGVVRRIIDAGGSLPTLYSLVENNPDVDTLNGYLAVMKKDMARVAAGA